MEKNKSNYIYKITSIESRKFIGKLKDSSPKMFESFKFNINQGDIHFNDFGYNKKPKSIEKNAKIEDYLKSCEIILATKNK